MRVKLGLPLVRGNREEPLRIEAETEALEEEIPEWVKKRVQLI
jgi:hypothetical protein